MGHWHVEVRERVRKKEIPKLPREVKLILDAALADLADSGPFPHGWNVDVLEKGKNRMWLKRKWRIVYTHSKEEITIEVIYAGSKEGVPY